MTRILSALLISLAALTAGYAAEDFVTVNGLQLRTGDGPYYFVGANYWYAGLLPLEKDKGRGIERLRRELDLLKRQGVTNLRLMAGAEGSGPLNGVERVGPALQPEQGRFSEDAMRGLDVVLAEMRKRRMRAVIFISNNWEWSGGFQQYLIWNGVISSEWLTKKPTWDELRDLTTRFYTCEPCKAAYARQAGVIIGRTNSVTKKRYADDPTVMAWEIANEPRPMRPAANDAYKKWIAETAAGFKRLAPRQLVTIGHEGSIGTESLQLFEEVHADPNVDYVTIHIWPKNWGWLDKGFDNAVRETVRYIEENSAVSLRLKKPLVIEEFGLPRDGRLFAPGTPTTERDRYFETVLGYVKGKPYIAGANFWAFGGFPRPAAVAWKPGNEYSGDPPMEEQGLNSVFAGDASTWAVIGKKARSLR